PRPRPAGDRDAGPQRLRHARDRRRPAADVDGRTVSATAGRAADASLRHLYARLRALDDHVRAAVERRRAGVHGPDDPFRGLYVSEQDVDALLAGPAEPLPALAAEAEEDGGAGGDDLRLRRLAVSFELEPVDVALLLVALAP